MIRYVSFKHATAPTLKRTNNAYTTRRVHTSNKNDVTLMI